jgi:hypothetical protein
MQSDQTLSDIYEGIADQLAAAREQQIMGNHAEALALMNSASLEYARFSDALRDYPGFSALDHAFTVTMEALCDRHQNAADTTRAAPESTRRR